MRYTPYDSRIGNFSKAGASLFESAASPIAPSDMGCNAFPKIEEAGEVKKPILESRGVYLRRVIAFLYFFLIIPFFACNTKTQEKHYLSQEEKQELKLLFHYLFAEHELGYTLFGDKPMSFCLLPTALLCIATHEHFFKIYMQGNHSFTRGLAAWDKLKTKNFHARYSLILRDKDGKHPFSAILINKKAFKKEFNKNKNVLQKKYGNDITATSFLEDLENKKSCLQTLFQDHLLLGILLGYGRRNAELFQRRATLSSSEIRIPFSPYPKPMKPFSSIEEELKYLDQHLQLLRSKNIWLLRVIPVNFAADPNHPETICLKKKYAFLHSKLSAIFKHDDWLDKLLLQMDIPNNNP